MPLPKDIQDIFFETLHGDRTVLDFEQWLYADKQLEHLLTPEDYLDLIGYGYKGDRAAYGLYRLLEKHIHPGGYKLWKQMREKYPQGYTPTPINTPFDEQLQRIKDKLTQARNADKDFRVFAASTHEYLLNVPATEEEILAFENKYSIQLPGCFRSFLLVVGNGGIGSQNAGAGPGYGIYPLGYGINEENKLKYNCLLDPDMTTDQWNALYRKEADNSFGGVLPLGTQGCTYIHAIVLNGPYKGRVVNLDYNYIIPPIFTPNTSNFLDYYEQWLDEVIDGTLQQPNAPDYGYYK